MFRSHAWAECRRHQLIDIALFMAPNDCCQRGAKPGEGIDLVELTGLDQRCDHGPVFCACLMSGEERVFAVEFDLNNPQMSDFKQNYGDFSRVVLQYFEYSHLKPCNFGSGHEAPSAP